VANRWHHDDDVTDNIYSANTRHDRQKGEHVPSTVSPGIIWAEFLNDEK
jgi:hypothetical protein